MNQTSKTRSFAQQVEQARTEAEREELRSRLLDGGYALFSEWLHELREELKRYGDDGREAVMLRLAEARRLLPEPGEISPSWTYVWDELERLAAYKSEVLSQVPPAKREGEWQVIMDNPYTTSPIVCYPELSFLEGAYMYAFLQLDLKKNEYVRLQKVESLLMTFGSREEKKGLPPKFKARPLDASE